ncbi:hypothetical protein [Aneurinibacillus tyrosinisolvens]|uniref:hypothetical protein n=1 Tax=Aneurinibacillus tyrosinisolvens TaxID=1443435 RepID=UPI00063EEFA5|nr:hypothetical protein [Aneurinibacillus tyrosinisolvens]
MLSDDFSTRLGWIKHHYVIKASQNGGRLLVKEKQVEGEAELLCQFQNEAFQFALEGTNKIDYLVNQKCADGIILEDKSGKWHLHIIECKKTVQGSSWGKAKVQFEGAILRMQSIAGLLGIRIENITLYTAFREDNLSQTTNPVLLKMASMSADTGAPGASTYLDWDKDEVAVLSLKKLKHVKIKLDHQGKNQIAI